jgi:hypothetical protein
MTALRTGTSVVRAAVAALVFCACAKTKAPVAPAPIMPATPAEIEAPPGERPFDAAVIKRCWGPAFRMDDFAAYLECGDGRVLIAPFGDEVVTLAHRPATSTRALVVDGNRVYFRGWHASEIHVAAREGGTSSLFFHAPAPVLAMAVDGNHLYVSLFYGGIQRISLTGGAPQVIVADARAKELAVDGANVAFVDALGTELFVTNVAGGQPDALGKLGFSIDQLALVSGRVFAIDEVDISSHARRPMPDAHCRGVIADRPFVFASCQTGVFGRTLPNGQWQRIAQEPSTAIAVNTNSVCWTDHDSEETTVRCTRRPAELRR